MLNRSASLAMSTFVLMPCLVNLISKDTHLVFSIYSPFTLYKERWNNNITPNVSIKERNPFWFHRVQRVYDCKYWYPSTCSLTEGSPQLFKTNFVQYLKYTNSHDKGACYTGFNCQRSMSFVTACHVCRKKNVKRFLVITRRQSFKLVTHIPLFPC